MNNKLIELFDDFKIVVYFPYESKGLFIQQLMQKKVNKNGEYINCMSWSEVHSTWTPTELANPYIGEANKPSFEKEIKLEFLCDKINLDEIVDFIKHIHPYETPEIDIIPIIKA